MARKHAKKTSPSKPSKNSIVIVSSKNQIVIPGEAREALGAKPGDRLIVTVRTGQVLLMQQPKSYRKAICGLAKGVYPPGYLEKERRSWD